MYIPHLLYTFLVDRHLGCLRVLAIVNSAAMNLLLLLSRFSRVRLCATHRRQPTRPPRPWDSPGQNTGVGCHFLLQCMKVKSEREVAQSCPTLSDLVDCSPPGSSIHGIFQAEVLEWGASAFSKSELGEAQGMFLRAHFSVQRLCPFLARASHLLSFAHRLTSFTVCLFRICP